MPTTTVYPASPKQVALITRLLGERDITGLGEIGQILARKITEGEEIGGRKARDFIDALIASPYREAEAAKPGYYLHQGDVVTVVLNREKTRTYAKRLVLMQGRGRWVYAPGLGRTLAGLEPLTVEEAARLGHKYGVCVVCAKVLSNPVSVEAGIGPVCRKRLG